MSKQYVAPAGYDWKAVYSSAVAIRRDIPSMRNKECSPGWYTDGNNYMLIVPASVPGLAVYVYSYDVREDCQNALTLPFHS